MSNEPSKLSGFLDKLNAIEADATERINNLLTEYGMTKDDICITAPPAGSNRYFSFFINGDKIF